MLGRCYTIPVILGLCLGMILAGVRISAGALGSAIGDPGVTSLLTIENKHGNNEVRLLGKKFVVNPPLPVGPEEFTGNLGQKASGIYSLARETAAKWYKNIFTAAGLTDDS
ncbi:MAG: hypothetical protein K6T65_14735 [Peptococcaceae bacterium]|nr:hypothetical protein [Peptococcaceae bacterium]